MVRVRADGRLELAGSGRARLRWGAPGAPQAPHERAAGKAAVALECSRLYDSPHSGFAALPTTNSRLGTPGRFLREALRVQA